MYIKSANVFGFGKLVDQKFDFQQDYQVIRGFNESGKTTLLAFIKAILFEFESAKSTEEQYIPKNANQYGGELVLVDEGSEWLIRRVKGKKVAGDVTVYKDGTEFPESALTDLLQNVDKSMYDSAYILNQKNLGNFDKLDRDQLIDDILTVGAVGGTEWLNLVKKLDVEAGDIYRPSKNAKKPLNLALKDYDELVKQQATMQDQKADFTTRSADLETLATDVKQTKEQRDKLFTEVNKQSSVLNKKSEYEEYLELNNLLTEDNTQPITNVDWDQFKTGDEQVKALQNNLDNAQTALPQLTDGEELILNNYHTNQTGIESIHTDLDGISRKEFNLEQLQTEMTNYQTEKTNILAANPKLSENMTPLTTDELSAVNNAIKKPTTSGPNNLYIAMGSAVVIVGGLFLPGIWKLISLVGALITGWFWYKSIQDTKNTNNDVTSEYLAKHNYRDLTLDEAVMWQPQIIQLQNVTNKLDQTTDNYHDEQRDLDAWHKRVDDLNIVEAANVKNVNSYFEQLNYLQKKQKDIQDSVVKTDAQNSELNQKLVTLTQQQNDLIAKYQLQTVADFNQKRITDLQLQDQINRRDVLKESLDTDLLAKIADSPNEFERITNELSIKQDQLNEFDRALNEKNGQLAQLQVEINNLANDDDYLRLEKAINDKQVEIIEYYDDWVSQKLGSTWVYDTLNLASSNRFPKMMDRTQKYFQILTTGKYVGVEFDEKTIEVQTDDSQKFELHELSTGTIAQLFIALRCAFVMEISDLVKLPILIDDAFNDFDKDRYEAAANLVRSMSEENQIFYVMTNNIPADYFDASHIIDLGGKND